MDFDASYTLSETVLDIVDLTIFPDYIVTYSNFCRNCIRSLVYSEERDEPSSLVAAAETGLSAGCCQLTTEV